MKSAYNERSEERALAVGSCRDVFAPKQRSQPFSVKIFIIKISEQFRVVVQMRHYSKKSVLANGKRLKTNFETKL